MKFTATSSSFILPVLIIIIQVTLVAICRRWGSASTRAAGKNYDDDDKYHQEQGLLVNNDDNDKYYQEQGLLVKIMMMMMMIKIIKHKGCW